MNFATLVTDTIKRWWIVLIIGILAVVLGISAFFYPLDTFGKLSTFAVIWLFASGAIKIFAVIRDRKSIPAWGWNLIAASLNIVLGILILSLPFGKELMLAFFAGFAVVFEGINLVFSSFALKQYEGSGWGWTLALGIITIILGTTLVSYPLMSMSFIVYLFGFAFIFTGIDLIASSIALSKIKATVEMAAREK